MAIYEKEEKQALVEEYKNSGKSIRGFAEEKGIPTSTFQGWLNEDQNLTFGAIEIKGSTPPLPRTIKPATVFATENIRIELREGFDKKLLRAVIEVVIGD